MFYLVGSTSSLYMEMGENGRENKNENPNPRQTFILEHWQVNNLFLFFCC